MRMISARLLATLAVSLVIATLVMWGWAPWLHGADSARLFGTGFVVLLGALAAGVGAAVVWMRAE